MKKRLIYSVISSVSLIIGAIFFTNPFASADDQPQTKGVMDDGAFVSLVRSKASSFIDTNDSQIVSSAKAVCSKLDAGLTGTQVHDSMVATVDPSAARDAEFFMSMSITQYCTKYEGIAAQYAPR